MKRVILSLMILFSIILDSNAFRIGGVNFSWKRGKPEWNATKTDVFCVGKGMCSGTITFDISTGTLQKNPDGTEKFDANNNEYTSNLVIFENKLAIEFSKKFYDANIGDFAGNLFQINGDTSIDYEVLSILGYNGSSVIKSGTYQFVKDNKTGAYLVVIN